jgi:hypothetical protein
MVYIFVHLSARALFGLRTRMKECCGCLILHHESNASFPLGGLMVAPEREDRPVVPIRDWVTSVNNASRQLRSPGKHFPT